MKGLPTSAEGFTSILVIDCMSRYCVLYLLKGETVGNRSKLVDFRTLWAPTGVHSDGGANFISNLSKAMATFGYDIHITDAHRPSAHGIVERLNKEVQYHLRAAYGKHWN